MSTTYKINVQGMELEGWIASLPDGASLQVINQGALSLFCKDTGQFFFIQDGAYASDHVRSTTSTTVNINKDRIDVDEAE